MFVFFISECWKDWLCSRNFAKQFSNFFTRYNGQTILFFKEGILLKFAISKNMVFILVAFEQFFCIYLVLRCI